VNGDNAVSYLRIMSFIIFAACCATAGYSIDTLLYSLPLSASGYSGLHVERTGKSFPDLTMKSKIQNSESESLRSLTAGFSGSHIDFIYSGYPSNSFSSVFILSFWHDKTVKVQYAVNEVSDSVIDLLGDTLPSAVSQSTSLNHIRLISEIRLNTISLLPDLGNVTFTLNPYIGIGLFGDFSFGSTSVQAVDSAEAYLDTLYSSYDTSISRFNVDVGFEIPVGIELFPLKKTSIPVLNSMGLTFTYSFMSGFRIVAHPDTNYSVNAYDKNVNNAHTSIYTTDGNSTETDNNDDGGKNDFWFGFKKIKINNEFRFGITILF
jgi:hypothetical protein